VDGVLGRGGMATVYAAEDIRHHRRVAIKVVHPELAAAIGGERFLTEIRTTATLQHPHVLGLIDSGESDGTLYYVMPFIAGESLRGRLSREGQLPVDEAVRIAADVAAALDYAHRQGVVHRDIKPENILLQDGRAVVADFGIALAISSAGGERLTQTGISLGTPQYMAPEQAMAERVIDARADIYALAAVTYEMLIGEPPFTGPSVQTIVARMMTERPRSLSSQRPSVSPAIDTAVLRALERLPADRYRTAGEFAQALSSTPPTAPAVAAPRSKPRPRLTTALFAAIVAFGVASGWLVGHRGGRAPTNPPSRLALVSMRLPGAGEISLHRQIAITPDGGTILYVTVGADGLGHMVRQTLTDSQATVIPGIRPWVASPSISWDGRSFLGLVSGDRQAYRFPVAGGAGQVIPLIGGGADFTHFDERGTVWFSPNNGGGLYRLDPGDTTAHFIKHSEGVRLQQLLPDGEHALVMTQATMQTGPAAIFDIESGTKEPVLVPAAQEVRFAQGYLVYALPNGTLEAVSFDDKRRRVTGSPVVVATNVSVTGAGIAQFALARNGTIAYIHEEAPSLVLVSLDGAAKLATEQRHNFHGPRFSPDGKRIAVDLTTEAGRDVWVLSLGDGTMSRSTFAGDGHDAMWTPDGRSIAFLSAKTGTEKLLLKRWSGSDAPDTLFSSQQLGFTGMWLPDASGLVSVVNELGKSTGADIALIGNGGRGPAKALVASEFNESYPAVSPDGKWFAFVSDQSGRLEVYIRPITGEGDQIQISQNGGTEPAWSPDGHEIFYRSVSDREPQLIAATISMSPAPSVGARRPLFSVVDIVSTQPHVGYDVSPDGKSFVMVRRSPPERIMVLQNLVELVRR
jgi:serine/threonine-protein kinase